MALNYKNRASIGEQKNLIVLFVLFRTGIVLLGANKGTDCLLGSRDVYPRIDAPRRVALAGSLVISQRSSISSIRCLILQARILRSLIANVT